jgi:leucyl-tRNA synthetase
MIHCPKCGSVPVPEKDLPVVLPDNVQFTGTGQSPLASCPEFVNVKCPKCGGDARRETDTMDTFVDSSWYFVRYCDPKNDQLPFDPSVANFWLPVDQYIGGIEHACMHLIYSRFWYKFMLDIKMISSDEPFNRLLTQGMVTLGGSAMSKSKGNIVTQDEIVANYGTDTARLFIMFAAPPEKQLEWSSDGLEGSWRFVNRVWRLLEKIETRVDDTSVNKEARQKLLHKMHTTIQKVTLDIEKEQQLNTAISAVMELVNEIYAYPSIGDTVSREAVLSVIRLLTPFTPHVCEEMWSNLGHSESLTYTAWPVANPEYLKEDTIELPIQVNGKMRAKMTVPTNSNETQLKDMILAEPKVFQYFEGKNIVKFIYVPGKIVNVIVK